MMPGSMHTADLVAVNPGLSLVQCRVSDHVAAGGWQLLLLPLPRLHACCGLGAAAAAAWRVRSLQEVQHSEKILSQRNSPSR